MWRRHSSRARATKDQGPAPLAPPADPGTRPIGSVVAVGILGHGEADVPDGLPGAVQVAAGVSHCLALRPDGTVVAWGHNANGQATVPPSLSGVVQVAAGLSISVALTSAGTVLAWGGNESGECEVPRLPAGAVQVDCGVAHGLALCPDGAVVGWGWSSALRRRACLPRSRWPPAGTTTSPSPETALSSGGVSTATARSTSR